MNPINNISASNAAYKVQQAAPVSKTQEAAAAAPTTPARGADSVELSGVQNFLQALKVNDVRADKVADVKAQIAAGTYETDEKLDIAADRLLDDLT
jgi:negative regulator of flagellin synthesis FlgM